MTHPLALARRTVLFAALSLLCASGWAQPVRAPGDVPGLTEVVAEARALAERHLADDGFPGLAVAVSVDGALVWSEGFGYADVEHRTPVWPTAKFRIGSISKPMTAAAVARLVAEGRLDVDAPVQTYVPSFPLKRWPLTTRQLGAHLGGIRHYRGAEYLSDRRYETVGDGLAIFAADTLLHAPGSAYVYSSYGWNLISAVVEGASGMPFLDYMDAHVFGPLGMVHTAPDYPERLTSQRVRFYVRGNEGALRNAPFVDNSYKWAGGGFLSTTEDLLRFAHAHLDAASLAPEARALLFTEQTTTDGEGVDYGFGWRIIEDDAGRTVWMHTGGSIGGTSYLALQPETGVAVVALINLSGASLDVGRALLDLFAEAVAEGQ